MESEGVSISSSGDESWNSSDPSSQNGRVVGRQLLSLIKPQNLKAEGSGEPQELTKEPSKSGRTKLSSGAMAFCPGGGKVQAPQAQAAKVQTDQLLHNLRKKLTEENTTPSANIPLPSPPLQVQLKASKSQEQSVEPAHEPLQSSPKRYSTFDPMQQLGNAPPSFNLESAPLSYSAGNLAQQQAPPTSKSGRTPLSSKAAAFQPRQFIPGNPVSFFGQPWIMDPHFPMNPNGFQLKFSTEMPIWDNPSVEAVQELDAEHSVAQPFEALLGKFEVSGGILVPKTDDSAVPDVEGVAGCPETPGKLHDMQLPASAVEDHSGADACSPTSTSTSTPAPQHQKVSWADLSDDEESSPWLTLANPPPEDRLQ